MWAHTSTLAFVLLNGKELLLPSPPLQRVRESMTPHKILIREAREADLSDVVTLRTNVFHPEYRMHSSYHHRVKETVKERIKNGASVLLAYRNEHGGIARGNGFFGNVVGTVEFSGNDFKNTSMETRGARRKLYIADLAVREDARRLGLASSLLRTVEEYAKANGFDELFLHVDLGNESGMGLYKKHGFANLGMADWARHFTETRLKKDADHFHFLYKSLRTGTSLLKSAHSLELLSSSTVD